MLQMTGFATEDIHLCQRRPDTTIIKEPGYLMQRLGILAPEILLHGIAPPSDWLFVICTVATHEK